MSYLEWYYQGKILISTIILDMEESDGSDVEDQVTDLKLEDMDGDSESGTGVLAFIFSYILRIYLITLTCVPLQLQRNHDIAKMSV